MAIERPTFHEAWYRVAELKARLLSSVRVSRQSYRGQLWYVLENLANNTYSRLDKDAYYFVGLLDGRRKVAEAWRIANERLGDRAPTQGEAIQILGQLYANGLLYADLPPDAQMLFKRHQSRVRKQVQGQLMSLLYLRVPVFDPDPILEQWVRLMGLAFTWPGLILWLGLIGTALYFVVGDLGLLASQSQEVLSIRNLPWLYLCFIVAKVLHEFGHAFACKRFGQINPGGGQVPTLGIMFLVFFPTPYVDTSSAWVFRSKWHRAVVGMAGVLAEMALAAVAAIVWANTSVGTLHSVAYNVIFVASVSTFLFNANPLLRFDAYYVLSDLLEIPNLGQRANTYLGYLVKRYAWGLKNSISPAYTLGEAVWFVLYGTTSAVYRVYISVRILLFMNERLPDQLFFLVPCMAISGLAGWIVVPIGRIIKYLATSDELGKKRARAAISTLATAAAAAILVGGIQLPDYWRVEGIVEPNSLSLIYAQTNGFVEGFLASDVKVRPGGEPLITAINPQLEAERAAALAERRRLEVQRRIARTQEAAAVQLWDEEIQALDDKIARVESQLASLRLQAPLAGLWVSPRVDRFQGLYVPRGERLGLVGTFDDLIIRAMAGQNVAAMVLEQASPSVEMRIPGRPALDLRGRIVEVSPEGTDVLPSQALGFRAGGPIPVRSDDPNGLRAAERVFEIRVRPDPDGAGALRAGHRVVVRIQMHDKPLWLQWWTAARQLFQRRFYL
jgi:putative peptide zinc metalloprotease protein